MYGIILILKTAVRIFTGTGLLKKMLKTFFSSPEKTGPDEKGHG